MANKQTSGWKIQSSRKPRKKREPAAAAAPPTEPAAPLPVPPMSIQARAVYKFLIREDLPIDHSDSRFYRRAYLHVRARDFIGVHSDDYERKTR